MNAARLRSLVVSAVILGCLGLWVALRWNVTTDISQFLPEGEQREQGRILQAVSRGVGSRTIILTMPATDATSAAHLSRQLEAELRAEPGLVDETLFIEGGPAEGVDEVLWRALESRRWSYLAADPETAAAMATDEGLTKVVRELKQRLASPMSTFIARTAPSDPFLALPRLFERLQLRRADALEIENGRFIADGRYAVLFVGMRDSALDANAGRRVLGAIERAVARVRIAAPEAGPLETSTLAKFSIQAEEMIRGDIARTTTLSVVGLTVLCLIVFRSLRLVALAVLPIGAAMLAATAVSLALFGQVHGLTFAFGASLIGVCVDYVVHLYVHHIGRADAGGPLGTMRRIWPALWVGALTTVVGFAVMAGSSFPGLRQVAVFASVGVGAALLSTRYLLPVLLPEAPRAGPAFRWISQGLTRAFTRLQRNRRGGFWLFGFAVVVAIVGVANVAWDDDLARLQELDPALIAEEERVRARVARFDQSRFVVALGDTEEQALQVNDLVADRMSDATEAGEIGAWQSVSPLLPSAERQRAVAETLRDDATLPARLRAALEADGFESAAFEPFFSALEQPWPSPLTFDELAKSPAAALVRPLRLEVDGRIAFLSLLRDVNEPAALAARFEDLPDAFYVDQTALMAEAMRAYRVRTLELLGLGLCAVLGILVARYRNLGVAVVALLPALLSAGVTLAVLAALRIPLNLIGLTAILMVLSIGVDYGVFLAEVQRDAASQDLSATLLALVLCWLTTVFGFGALVLSVHPAMHMIGLVAAVGVTSSLLLAPMTFALLPPRKDGA